MPTKQLFGLNTYFGQIEVFRIAHVHSLNSFLGDAKLLNHCESLTYITLSVIINTMLLFKERLNADKNYYSYTDSDQESEQLAEFAFKNR